MLLGALHAQAATVTGMIVYDTTGSGGSMVSGGANTLGGDFAVNLYLNTGSGFVNSGDSLSSTAISVPLAPGTYTWTYHVDASGSVSGSYMQLDLFFDGNKSNAGITGVVPIYNPSPSLSAPTTTTSYDLGFNSSTGSNSLSFVDGSNTVTLTNFTFLSGGTDLVSPFDDVPNGVADFYGAIALNVQGTASTPEPASLALAIGGLMLLVVRARFR
jgi:hypothetical protein